MPEEQCHGTVCEHVRLRQWTASVSPSPPKTTLVKSRPSRRRSRRSVRRGRGSETRSIRRCRAQSPTRRAAAANTTSRGGVHSGGQWQCVHAEAGPVHARTSRMHGRDTGLFRRAGVAHARRERGRRIQTRGAGQHARSSIVTFPRSHARNLGIATLCTQAAGRAAHGGRPAVSLLGRRGVEQRGPEVKSGPDGGAGRAC